MTQNCITPREKEILHFLSLDLTSRELAQKLFISIETVYTHRKNLNRKLGAKTSAGLISKSYQLGLLQVTDSLSPTN